MESKENELTGSKVEITNDKIRVTVDKIDPENNGRITQLENEIANLAAVVSTLQQKMEEK